MTRQHDPLSKRLWGEERSWFTFGGHFDFISSFVFCKVLTVVCKGPWECSKEESQLRVQMWNWMEWIVPVKWFKPDCERAFFQFLLLWLVCKEDPWLIKACWDILYTNISLFGLHNFRRAKIWEVRGQPFLHIWKGVKLSGFASVNRVVRICGSQGPNHFVFFGYCIFN